MMRTGVISIFPEMVQHAVSFGMTQRALEMQKLELLTFNPRDYVADAHRKIDDRPYGGGPGMVMMVEPLQAALQDARKALAEAKVIHMSPQGRVLTQDTIKQLVSGQQEIILIAGRYEGIDERFIELEVDEEWSIGDYVLSGGELAALVVIDAISRYIPGVLGHESSAAEDSFAAGLLDCPHYTRPETVAGLEVPSVLTSGDHDAIRKWRLKQSLGRTLERRPELLDNRQLTDEERELLEQYKQEQKN